MSDETEREGRCIDCLYSDPGWCKDSCACDCHPVSDETEPPGEFWKAQFAKARHWYELNSADEDTGDLEYTVYEFRCATTRPCFWITHMEFDQGYHEAVVHQRKTGHVVQGRPMVRPEVDFRGLDD